MNIILLSKTHKHAREHAHTLARTRKQMLEPQLTQPSDVISIFGLITSLRV